MSLPAQQGWWMTEPVRWLQTNLPEPDAATDPLVLVRDTAALRANVLHLNMGGIAATYPTKIPFHTRSSGLGANRDFFGDALKAAHASSIRVVGRFDFSKARQDAFNAHPEWFFRKADGSPVIYNGLYSTCINSAWYAEHAPRILAEALEAYDVDGLFFNMFGNQNRDYSGTFVGHCHCGECKRRFREEYSRDLPADEKDPDYLKFMFTSSRRVAREFGRIIHEKRPKAGYFNYLDEWTDGIMSESNTAVSRPLPLWPYASSENVNRARNSQPAKMSVNLCMQFVDYAWRFATVPVYEHSLRLWQNIAHGGALAFSINGTPARFEDRDMQGITAARPIFEWAAKNEQYLAGQESLARVILLRGGDASAYRGLFRLLSEAHIPFAAASNLDWIGKRPVDLVVTAGAAPAGLAPFVRAGGKVLAVGATPPAIGEPGPVKRMESVKGYVRVRTPSRFPSLNRVSLLMLDGPFSAAASALDAPLTLVPQSQFGPPEFVHVDMLDTTTPALVPLEKGAVLWVPFELGTLYYKHSLPAHAGLLRDLVESTLPRKQLTTDAHPLVEMSLMRQKGRTLLHLVNLSGHSQTGYFAPIPMQPIQVSLEGEFRLASALRAGTALKTKVSGGRTTLTIPSLRDYDLIVLTQARTPGVRK
jgi:hypothetical protein